VQGQIIGGTDMHRDETVLAVGLTEAARRLGLSTRTVATLVLSDELPSRKVGRRRIIPVVALEAFLRGDHRTGRIGPKETVQEGSRNTR
jgi:excisionase family DNA binding protein